MNDQNTPLVIVVLLLLPILALSETDNASNRSNSASINIVEGDVPRLSDLDKSMMIFNETITDDDLRKKAIENYKAYILESPGALLSARAMRRLADLQLDADSENAEIIEDESEDLYALHHEAIKLYEKALTDNPDYGDNSHILYQLSKAYDEIGEQEKLLITLERLVEEYPDYVHIAESQYRLGELHFQNKRYYDAEVAFKAVGDHGSNTSFYEQAQYKLGWSFFKQTLYNESFESFMILLDHMLEGGSAEIAELTRSDQEFLEDVFRVVSLSLSYEAGPKTLSDFFEKNQDRSYEHITYDRLADFYVSKKQFIDAVDVYETFVAQNPGSRYAPITFSKTIDAYEQGGFPQKVIEAKLAFTERYSLESPYWEANDIKEYPEVFARLEKNYIDLMKVYHSKAQGSKKPSDYLKAEEYYREYLVYFPDSEVRPEMHFLLGDLLYEAGKFDLASEEYVKVAYMYDEHSKASEAGYASVISYSEYETLIVDQDEKSKWHVEGIENALKFSETFPKHPQSAAVLAQTAQKLFELKEYERAAEVASRVSGNEEVSDPKLRQNALLVQAHSAFDQEKYNQAEAFYVELKQQITDQQELIEIEKRIAASIYKNAEKLRSDGDLNTAAEEFLRLGKVVPGSETRITAEYDAAAVYIELEDWANASRVLNDFRNNYPDNALQAEVTRRLAFVYQKSGDNKLAAQEFGRIGSSGDDPELQRQALLQAVDLYKDAEDEQQLAATLKSYLSRFPLPLEDAQEAREQLVTYYEKLNQKGEVIFWRTEQVAAFQSVTDPVQQTERSKFIAAKAKLALSEPILDEYQRIDLVLPLNKSVKDKKAKMELALAAYNEAASYGIVNVTTAATHNIATIYHHFSNALLDSERPNDLEPDVAEQYEYLLEDQAYPLEEKAIELYELNAQRVVDKIYDEWVEKSIEELAILMPGRYAKNERSEKFTDELQ